MKKLLIVVSLFFFQKALAFQNIGDYKKLNFNKYLDGIGLKIIDLVDKADNPFYYIKENTPDCKSGEFYGYVNTYLNPQKADFVVCTYSIYYNLTKNYQEFVHEINDTVRHEAAHAGQICKKGDYSLGVNKARFKGYPERMVSYYKNLSKTDRLMELEAFALEDDPVFVLNSLKRFCL